MAQRKKLTLSFLIGTRPETIKLAPVILEARRRGHRAKVILTGQHRHMTAPLLKFFGIKPDVDLDVMSHNQTLTGLSARVLDRMDHEKKRIEGDFLIVQGDTTSVCMAAYWGFCHRIPVAHVEAGLRTYDLNAPFPEEANRQLVSRVAAVHFAPTAASRAALKAEQIPSPTIHVVGNTAIDALSYTLARLSAGRVPAEDRLPDEITRFAGSHPLVLVTAHRRESFGSKFEDLCHGIYSVAESNPDLRVVYPVHPNPNVRAPVQKLLKNHPRILLCDPVPYVAFVALMQRADVLLTDSGGIQEEGPTLRKPILVMRDETERPEGVRAGFAKMVGTDSRLILRQTLRALERGCEGRGKNPYGDGKTSARIVSVLEKLGPRKR